jgi:aldehyde:ferredoxin oxidoreductase
MKRAGIDIIVVSHQSDRPVRIEINGDRDEVEFIDASDLWGKGTYETQEILGKKKARCTRAALRSAGSRRRAFRAHIESNW